MGFPGGSDGKESAYYSGDLGSIPGLGRSPERRKWQPTPAFLPGQWLLLLKVYLSCFSPYSPVFSV